VQGEGTILALHNSYRDTRTGIVLIGLHAISIVSSPASKPSC
jgi:hypothetical protein